MEGLDRGIWAEIACPILGHASGGEHAGICLLPGDLHIGVAFVIFEAHVIAWLVALYEGVLKDQGLDL